MSKTDEVPALMTTLAGRCRRRPCVWMRKLRLGVGTWFATACERTPACPTPKLTLFHTASHGRSPKDPALLWTRPCFTSRAPAPPWPFAQALGPLCCALSGPCPSHFTPITPGQAQPHNIGK